MYINNLMQFKSMWFYRINLLNIEIKLIKLPLYLLNKMALLCSDAVQVAPLRLCFYLLFYLLLLSPFTHITSAVITYDKGTLLDIGYRFTNLFQDTLSLNPSWPLEILRNAENNGHRRRNKKHHGKSSGIRNRLRKRAHSPPLPSILLANVQSLENKMDDLRARISFQRDIRDCNIICLTETWLTPSDPDTAVTPSDNFSNRTMPPFFSHRNINKGSLRTPWWREKWRAGPPTQKLCYRRLLMTSTGTCSGRVHLTSASSRM